MNHRLTIVSKKSGTVKGLGKNPGNNKGKRVQKGAETEDRGFDYFALAEACRVGGRVLFTLHSALLWQNRTRQRSQAVSPMTNTSGLGCRRPVSISTHSLHRAVLTMCLCRGEREGFFSLRVGKPTTLYQDDSLFMTDLLLQIRSVT